MEKCRIVINNYFYDYDEERKCIVHEKVLGIDTTVTISDDLTIRKVIESTGYRIDGDIFCMDLHMAENPNVYQLMFYYDEDILYTDYNVIDVKIKDFKEYGYDIGDLITISGIQNPQLGGSCGPGFINEIYDNLNSFVSKNPLLMVLLEPLAKKFIECLSKRFNNYFKFQQGLFHRKTFSLESFTKAVGLSEIRDELGDWEYRKIVNAFLIVQGYTYDYENEVWERP